VSYFIDSDIFILAIRGKSFSVRRWFHAVSPEQIKVPAIVAAELFFGAYRSSEPERALARVRELLGPFEIVPFDAACASIYAKIRFELQKNGTPIGSNDFVIAAIALARHGTLVTHNIKEFSRVRGLKTQDWTKDR